MEHNIYVTKLLDQIQDLLKQKCTCVEEEEAIKDNIRSLAAEAQQLLSQVESKRVNYLKSIVDVVEAFIHGYVHVHTVESIIKLLRDMFP